MPAYFKPSDYAIFQAVLVSKKKVTRNECRFVLICGGQNFDGPEEAPTLHLFLLPCFGVFGGVIFGLISF